MRAPFNVLVLPFHRQNGQNWFCVFKREDMKIWQFIAGGGEDKESPLVAAQRESFEEAGISRNFEYKRLETMCYVPANCFSEAAQKEWKKYVIPVYTFYVEVDSLDIKLSDEHTEFKWCAFDEAMKLVHFDLDRTALYELNERIKNDD